MAFGLLIALLLVGGHFGLEKKIVYINHPVPYQDECIREYPIVTYFTRCNPGLWDYFSYPDTIHHSERRLPSSGNVFRWPVIDQSGKIELAFNNQNATFDSVKIDWNRNYYFSEEKCVVEKIGSQKLQKSRRLNGLKDHYSSLAMTIQDLSSDQPREKEITEGLYTDCLKTFLKGKGGCLDYVLNQGKTAFAAAKFCAFMSLMDSNFLSDNDRGHVRSCYYESRNEKSRTIKEQMVLIKKDLIQAENSPLDSSFKEKKFIPKIKAY